MKIRREKRKARVEILPLMDVIFLLLVFFIYSMIDMAVQRGMTVNLPVSVTAETQAWTGLSVTIKADQSLFLEKEPVSLEGLAAALDQRVRQAREENASEAAVRMFADDELSYGKLYQVLDVVKRAGVRKISLQARQP